MIDPTTVILAAVMMTRHFGELEAARRMEAIVADSPSRLELISKRRCKVCTASGALTDRVDQWRCRSMLRPDASAFSRQQLVAPLVPIGPQHRWMHSEGLDEFDGGAEFTRVRGED